ncbi:MAG: DMT family transporter, partial [Pseudomonadota bacterium]
TKQLPMHVVRAALQAVAMLGWFYGLTLIPMATVAALAFTTPLFATLLAILLLGERVGWRRWSALVVGFLGTLVILRPDAGIVDPGALYVLVSALAWGGVLIVVKVLGRRDSSLTITLYAGFFLVLFTLVPALFVWSWPSARAFGLLVLIGLVATGIQLCVTEAVKVGETSAVLPMDFTKLLWGALIGFFLFGEIPDAAAIVGGTLVFGAVLYVAYREARRKAPLPPAPA